MLEIYLFVLVFSFYCWLFCLADKKRQLQGWNVIEPDTGWIGWCCELPAVSALQKLGIRQLKKLAREKHIRGYGDMTKSQLIAALSV